MAIRMIRIRYLAVLALFWLIAGSVCAASLRQNSIVQNDQITLGDIFDGLAPEIATKPISAAPAPGRRIVYDPRMLDQIAKRHNIDWQPTSMLDTVTVERAAQTITTAQIVQRLGETVQNQIEGHEKVSIVLDNPNQTIQLPTTVPASFGVSNLTVDPTSRRLNATIFAPADGAPIIQTSIAGRAIPLQPVPVLADGHRTGQIIRAEDLIIIDTPIDRITPDVLTNQEEIIGRAPKRGINARALIKDRDIQMPVLVKRGDLVTLSYHQGGMALTIKARALDDGAKGALIRIQNMNTKKVIDAVVAQAGLVTIEGAETPSITTSNKGETP